MRWRPARIGVAAGLSALAALVGVGCSSSDSSSPAESTSTATTVDTQGTAELCSDYEELKASVQRLVTLDVIAAGTDGINAAVDDVKNKAATLVGSAGVFEPQVTAVTDAIDQLQSTLRALSKNGLGDSLPKISREIDAIRDASVQLGSAVKDACP